MLSSESFADFKAKVLASKWKRLYLIVLMTSCFASIVIVYLMKSLNLVTLTIEKIEEWFLILACCLKLALELYMVYLFKVLFKYFHTVKKAILMQKSKDLTNFHRFFIVWTEILSFLYIVLCVARFMIFLLYESL